MGEPPHLRSTWSRADLPGVIATVASVLVGLTIPLLADSGYYFRGDTQAAYFGWWFHVGEELRAGNLPILDVQAWRAGNLTAEGQWALYNPVVWLLGLLATEVPSVIGLITGVKFAVTCFGSVGVYVLVRSYAAHPAAAYVAGLGSAFGGMTLWLDQPSWAAGLAIWALVPWCWWAIRNTAFGANPLPALVLCYLLITTGYVYGPIMLGVVLVALLVEAHDRRAVLSVVGISLFCGLVAVAVYLPSLLSVTATIRADTGFAWEGDLTTTPRDVLTSFLPSSGAEEGFEQQTSWRYAGWYLPLFALVRWRAVRASWKLVAAPLVAGVLIFLVVNGPGVVGPLRWPMRLHPFLVQFLAVLLAVLISHNRASLSRARALVLLAWVGGATLLWVLKDSASYHLLAGAVVLVAVTVVALIRRPLWAGAFAGLVTLGVVALHMTWFPEPPSDQRNLPRSLDGYTTQLTSAEGDVLVVGQQDNRTIEDPALAAEVLDGSAWYLTDHDVQNIYTTISHRAYYDRYCIRIHGQTCPEILDDLFSVEPVTGRPRIDLLSISTLLIIKADLPTLPPPPSGWHVSASTDRTETWVRDEPLPTAGGPVWTSPGTSVSVASNSDRTVVLDVSSVPASGGTVVLSRLDWPGYTTSVGELTDSVDDYLLTLSLPASAAGETVTMQFDPPGWKFELACLWVALIGGLGWTVIRRRQQKWQRWWVRQDSHP